jgi:hypothetical protein
MILHKYSEFILESHLELLLEANLKFTKEFKEILDEIGGTVADNLLQIQNTEVDINTNFIDIDTSKDASILFIPENKIKGLKYRILDRGDSYDSLTRTIWEENSNNPELKEILTKYWFFESNVKTFWINGLIGEIKDIELDDLIKMNTRNKNHWENWYSSGNPLVMFKWQDSGQNYICIFEKSGVTPDIKEARKSDMNVGRFTRRALEKSGIKVLDTDLESFVTKYKSILNIRKDALSRFSIVKGEDIRKYYHKSTYNREEYSLGGSCMRYDKCQKYLDIYVENPEACELVIFKTPLSVSGEEDKITGRALLWTDKEGRKIMDRIYVSNSPDEAIFIEFAKKNGFLYKSKQDNDESTSFMEGEKEVKDAIYIYLKQGEYRYYPYMDTFKFFKVNHREVADPEKRVSVLTNHDGRWDYKLEETDGGNGSCSECGGGGRVECSCCNGSGEESCYDCNARGNIRCCECSGEGQHECAECDASGEIECRECSGSGKIEGDEGEEDCPDCDGSGKEDCPDCDSGYIKCSECNGDGEVECSNCDGRGVVECGDCGGDCEVSCPECG